MGMIRCSTPQKKPLVGRSRQTVDSYIADLRAATQMGMDIKTFRMNRLGIPQDRIAKRAGVNQVLIHNHLLKMPVLAKSINADLSRGFTVAQVAEKHNWTDPMVWSLALEAKEDLERFKELGWGLRTWDQWEVAAQQHGICTGINERAFLYGLDSHSFTARSSLSEH